jgi:hypothetical protein
MIPNFRAHIENAFQNMEETGLAFLVFTLDSTSYRRFMRTSEDFIIPAFVSEHPYNIILPPDTKFIDDTDRYVRVLKFTPDQFEVKAKENPDWPRDTVRKILDMKRALPQGDASGDSQELSLYGYQPRVSGETTDRVDPTIYLHEAAYTKEGKRRFNKYSVDLPDEQLEDVEWSWEEEPDRTREWPLVACVAERRNLEIMDSRGGAELLKDNQLAASQYKNLQGIMFDYTGIPLFEGGNTFSTNKFKPRPGAIIPDGLKPVQLPDVSPQFAFSIDQERREAAIRIGGNSGAQSSTSRSKDPITATEANRVALRS